MATRQQQKSAQTRAEIKQSALELILQKGYDNISVADIVANANCSVGAFYGHFKSKQSLASELWVEFITSFIDDSVEEGSTIRGMEQFVDYLINRSEQLANNKKYIALHICSTFDTREGTARIGASAAKYTEMLRNALLADNPEADAAKVATYASIMHTTLNAHAERFEKEPYLSFDGEGLRNALLLIANASKRDR